MTVPTKALTLIGILQEKPPQPTGTCSSMYSLYTAVTDDIHVSSVRTCPIYSRKSVLLCFWWSVCVCLCTSPSFCPHVCLSVCPSVHLSIVIVGVQRRRRLVTSAMT